MFLKRFFPFLFTALFFLPFGCFASNEVTRNLAQESIDTGRDARRESQLHNIFETYYSEPVSEQEWGSLLGGRRSEIYKVQQGDSLWEISKTFFGNGEYWPKIWSLNYGISNPHHLDVGTNIVFVLGTEQDAPQVLLRGKGSDGVMKNLAELPSSQADSRLPSSVPLKPMLKRLPASFGKWTPVTAQKSVFVGSVGLKRESPATKFWLTQYILDKLPDSLGSVIEMGDAKRSMARLKSIVYVRLETSKVQPGERLSIGSFRQFKNNFSKAFFSSAYSISLVGELEIISQVSSSFFGGSAVYRAIVSKAVEPVFLGAQIFKTPFRQVNVSLQGEPRSLDGRIIGSGEKGTLFGPRKLAYINRGSRSGLVEGDLLEIYEDRSLRNQNTRIKKEQKKIGLAQAVAINENSATILIVKSWGNILKGDYVGRSGGESKEDVSLGSSAGLTKDFFEKDGSEEFLLENFPEEGESEEGEVLSLDDL